MKPLYLKGGWAYCSDQITQFIPDLTKTKKLNVIEFGAGDSSIKIYEHINQIYDDISYLCYETSNYWAPNHLNVEVIMYQEVTDVVLREQKYDLVLVDGPTGITRKFWYEKLKNIVKPGTIIHIDDYDHYTEFEEELIKNLKYEELYRKSRKVKGEKSWLTVKIID
tara:strand:- start:1255 stop:1752 length:498 start_codon:yes stop_codon:yes gene_type:complete